MGSSRGSQPPAATPAINFDAAFKKLTDNPPFPWQRRLYERFVADGTENIPAACSLPTGLGKTSVVAVWLLALAKFAGADSKIRIPRRLVYVVNRRTVVDQTTAEVEKYRERPVEASRHRFGRCGEGLARPVPRPAGPRD